MGAALEIGNWKLEIRGLVVFVILFIGLVGVVSALPTGPNSVLSTANETWGGGATASMVNVSGGYLSKFNLSSTVQDRNWKAIVGQIDGRFTLDDSSGSAIYDWSLSSVAGQVYASRDNSVAWGTIECASRANIEAEDVALEHTGEDNINSTFNGTNLETYFVAGVSIGAGTCASTNSYDDNGAQTNDFEEIVLYDSSDIVFATEINDDTTGYDGNSTDFQMIVPQNGNESVALNTLYYLYVEILS